MGGADGWLREQAIDRIVERQLGPAPAPWRLRRLHASAASADAIRSAARTIALGGDPVVALEGLRLKPPRASKAEVIAAAEELIRDPMRRGAATVEWEAAPDRTRKTWKDLAPALRKLVADGTALVVDCDPPSERELPAWIRRRADAIGLALPREGAALLAERFGSDLRRQVGELEKLSVYLDSGTKRRGIRAPGGVRCGSRTWRALLGGGSGGNRFRFSNALQDGRTAEALASSNCFCARESARRKCCAWSTASWRSSKPRGRTVRGPDTPPLNEVLGRMPPWVADRIRDTASRFTPAQLRRILSSLVETDLRMKTTGIPSTAALAAVALQLRPADAAGRDS